MTTESKFYPKKETSKLRVNRIDGLIEPTDYFDSMEEVNEHIADEMAFDIDTDEDSFSIEEI